MKKKKKRVYNSSCWLYVLLLLIDVLILDIITDDIYLCPLLSTSPWCTLLRYSLSFHFCITIMYTSQQGFFNVWEKKQLWFHCIPLQNYLPLDWVYFSSKIPTFGLDVFLVKNICFWIGCISHQKYLPLEWVYFSSKISAFGLGVFLIKNTCLGNGCIFHQKYLRISRQKHLPLDWVYFCSQQACAVVDWDWVYFSSKISAFGLGVFLIKKICFWTGCISCQKYLLLDWVYFLSKIAAFGLGTYGLGVFLVKNICFWTGCISHQKYLLLDWVYFLSKIPAFGLCVFLVKNTCLRIGYLWIGCISCQKHLPLDWVYFCSQQACAEVEQVVLSSSSPAVRNRLQSGSRTSTARQNKDTDI